MSAGRQIARIPPRPYLRNEVFQILKGELAALSLGLSEPAHISEAELARALGVSRTPVREALNRLEQEGLVTVIPHKGARLMPTSVEEYLGWLDLREVLEGLAARAAASRMTEADFSELRGLFRPFREEALGCDAAAYAKANVRFHALLLERCGNPLLQRTFRQYDHMAMIQLRIIERLDRARNSLREHRRIIAALERRDGAAAEEAARRHIRSLRLAAEQHLSSLVFAKSEAAGEQAAPTKSKRRNGPTRGAIALKRTPKKG